MLAVKPPYTALGIAHFHDSLFLNLRRCRELHRSASPVGRPLVRCLLSPVNPDVLLACRYLATAQVIGTYDDHRTLTAIQGGL